MLKAIISIDAIKNPLTGIGRYCFELASNLAKELPAGQLRYMRGSHLHDAITLPARAAPTAMLSGLRGALARSALLVSAYQWHRSRRVASTLRSEENCVYHGPNFYLPEFRGRSIVTIHDLSIFSHPECHPPERVRFMRTEILKSVRRADRIITDSEFVREEVSRQFGYSLNRIHAIPLASGPEFRPRNVAESEQVLVKFKLRRGLYSLFVGTIEPRKNLETLLQAYSALPIEMRRAYPLIIIGYRGWRTEALHQRIASCEREGWLRYLGFVDSADLPVIFSGARLFVYPSVYEGFGLPVLEAMASGVPVICANNSALTEVAGEAAAKFSAYDMATLKSLLLRGLEDPEWRTQAVSQGLERSENFTWARCAAMTAAVYRATEVAVN